MKSYFKKNFFSYTIIFLMIFLVSASYYRFIIKNDYLVYYEVECDPVLESCFMYCEDEECSDPFFYKKVIRDARRVKELCGIDVRDCDAASICVEDEVDCNIDYCNLETENLTCDNINI